MKASFLKSVAVKNLVCYGVVIFASIAITSFCGGIYARISTARSLPSRALDKNDNFLGRCELLVITRIIAQPNPFVQSPA
jgi:hypothetical protein